jgi:hypothetical protein
LVLVLVLVRQMGGSKAMEAGPTAGASAGVALGTVRSRARRSGHAPWSW